MSFPRYPAYKPSGVEWLGEVPEHWASRRLGFFFAERREKVSDKDFQALSVTKDGIVPQLDTAAKTDDGDNRKCVRTGDFVINSRSDRKGSSGLSRLDGSVSLICTVLRPQESVQGGFIHHLLRSVSFQEEFYRFGKGIVADLWSTNFSAMSGITLAMPPLEEQESIASFLDHETAKIDALIAEQQRLIELLQEKRQAVISHAVTKGLNPDAPMKNSGVEWLGEVPEHWEKSRLRALFRQEKRQDQPTSPVLSVYRDYGVILKDSRDDNHNKTPESLSAYQLVNRDDLVVNKMKAWQGSLGVSVLHGITSPDYAVFTPHHNEFSLYLHFLLRSCRMTSVYRSISNGIRPAQWRIEPGVFLDLPVFLPPTHEQELIAGHISRESEKFDQLVKESESFVNLLQERRSALISAAVTGQIDVRGLVPEAEAA